MKLLSEKFTAYEIWDPDNTRYDLQRLDQPVHTYRDEEHGLIEGGMFVFAYGTNPEILLFLEARVDPNDKSKITWQFTGGRSSGAEIHLELDGKDAWKLLRAGPAVDRPYWSSQITTKFDSDLKK